MAVLVTKTMGQMNEERKSLYSLFQKPSKAIKSENKAAPSLQQIIDATPADEPAVEKVVGRRSKKPKKSAKDDLPTSRFSAVFSSAVDAELLDVDPNNDRRKRQKAISPSDEKSEPAKDVLPISPLAERRPQQTKSSSGKAKSALGEECLAAETIASASEKDVGKTGSDHRESEPSIPDPRGIGAFNTPQPGEAKANVPQILPKWHTGAHASPITILEDGSENKGSEVPTVSPNKSKTKRILHFNVKTGTIGSPPSKKNAPLVETKAKTRSTTRARQPKSKLVTIHYGQGKAMGSSVPIGLRIDQILMGTRQIIPSPKKKAPLTSNITEPPGVSTSKKTKSSATITSKTPVELHPFFSGKSVSKSSVAKETAKGKVVSGIQDQETRSVGTRRGSKGKLPSPSKPRPALFAAFSGFGTNTKIMKFPGAMEPAWPWKDMVHIRGNAKTYQNEQVMVKDASEVWSKAKKLKYLAVEILAEEDIMQALAVDLEISQVLRSIRDIKPDDYPQLPSCLRVPIRHFESGYQLQKRVQKELHVRLSQPNITNDVGSSEDETKGQRTSRIHPAVLKAYGSIATSFTAFDQFRYETQPWTHKHAPKCAAEVLQTGREAGILKEWLQNLVVQSVEASSSDRTNSRSSSVFRRSAATAKSYPAGKRKRKSKKLDGFVISDDEENDAMDEISEPEEDNSPRGSQSLLKKTVIRQGDAARKGSRDAQRLTNAIVISGPHGCGKTAAVYAVAKELGFEVFEINSSSRRSGKDILEKVGDMTRNHLVHQSHDQPSSEPLDEVAQRLSDALAGDIKSGRQGTMNSFFNAQDAPKLKPKSNKSNATAKVPHQDSPRSLSKQQKQSLILFEEVDVLYEEDKQFWTTVTALISQSKRPIIMTCHDESVLPLHSLTLHAILRFTPPPIDLATDYMLLVAANEGHALQRDAVKSLYRSRHFDLRASLTELNFWCQFAVGDVKGGLDWLLRRWPPGSDVDEHGNTVRVVSEKTYEAGMGWFSQDFLESHMHYLDIEEETLHEAWDGWRLDLGHWEESIDMTGWANKAQALSRDRAETRARLSIYDDFADTMSMADLCSGSTFAPDDQVQLDASIPQLSDKAREDFLMDHPLIEAASLPNFDNTRANISFWIKSRARKYLQVDQHVKHGLEVPSQLERPSEAHIIGLVENQISSPEFTLTRQDFNLAFDSISEPAPKFLGSNVQLEGSAFHRTESIITTELAPYVRSIITYDTKLQQDRARLSNLLSACGRKGKRMRTTRSALSALEGGARSSTRRERYFGADLNPYLVLKTGMPSWLEALPSNTSARATTASTPFSSGESSDPGIVATGKERKYLSEDTS